MTAADRRLSLVHSLAEVIPLPQRGEQDNATPIRRRKRTRRPAPNRPTPGPGDAA